MTPDQGTEVDANELVNELGMQIAQLVVQNTALRLENAKLRENKSDTIDS